MIYVVNFSDNNGFAILAANRNMPDPVIAIVDHGRMDQHLHFCTNIETKSASQQDTTKEFVNNLLHGYLDYIHDSGGFDNGGGGDDNPPGGNNNGPWITDSTITPMMRYIWCQKDPFNYYCPVASNDTTHLPTGCVPLATAMIIAYNQYPSSLTLDGRQIIWDKVHNAHYYWMNALYNYQPYYTEEVAYLVHEIGEFCGTWYHEGDGWFLTNDFSFTMPENAKDFLNDIGYNASKHNGYNVDLITPMLVAGKPVFIAAISGLAQGHAWVIDGAMFQSRGTESRQLLHCNWGFGGLCNGFYTSGVFDLTQGPVANNFNYDPHDGYTYLNYTYLDYTFDHWYRIITY